MPKFGLDESIINEIIEIFKKYEEVENAKIFGSRARGNHRKGSDIDIALFGENLTHTINTKIFWFLSKNRLTVHQYLHNLHTVRPCVLS